MYLYLPVPLESLTRGFGRNIMSERKIPIVNISDQPTGDGPVQQWQPGGMQESGGELESESRRNFIKKSAGLSTASLVGTAALLTGTDDAKANTSWAEHFQGNYRLMTDEEKAEAIDRLECAERTRLHGRIGQINRISSLIDFH